MVWWRAKFGCHPGKLRGDMVHYGSCGLAVCGTVQKSFNTGERVPQIRSTPGGY